MQSVERSHTTDLQGTRREPPMLFESHEEAAEMSAGLNRDFSSFSHRPVELTEGDMIKLMERELCG